MRDRQGETPLAGIRPALDNSAHLGYSVWTGWAETLQGKKSGFSGHISHLMRKESKVSY